MKNRHKKISPIANLLYAIESSFDGGGRAKLREAIRFENYKSSSRLEARRGGLHCGPERD